MKTDIEAILTENSRFIENRLYQLKNAIELPQQAVIDAMLYSLEAGGKRLRPTLVIEFCKACGGTAAEALDYACAVEMVHTYSLIHDDLPCMDNDDLRRGKPSNHKVFGEATALLAGDALLTMAFEALAHSGNDSALAAVRVLSNAAGVMGMVGGQILDIEGESKVLGYEELLLMHRLKTGALFMASAKLGCIAAGADAPQINAAGEYSQSLGLAFQIRDDMLDVIGDSAVLGKAVGADSARGKSTLATLLGIKRCGELVIEETKKAKSALGDNIFTNKEILLSLADYLALRQK